MSRLTPILTDASTLRQRIHQKATEALTSTFPLDLKGRTLEVKDLHVHAKEYSPLEQKEALLTGGSLSEAVKGTLVLKDGSGKILDTAKNFTLVHLPFFTERHTIIAEGNEYQVANMLRRKPGIYTQRGENGELHTTFNLSKGKNFNLGINPQKGTLYMQYGASNIPLYPILKSLGVSHEDIAKHWGSGIAAANRTEHGHQQDLAMGKLYAKLEHPAIFNAKATHEQKELSVKKRLDATGLNPDVVTQTLGTAHNKVTSHALLQASQKLLQVHEGKQEVDDADSLAFKSFHSLDDFLAERIKLTARTWGPKARFAFVGKNNVREALRPAPFSESLRKWVTTSQLSSVPTGINPLELIDHAVKVTSLGEGGIPSERAIPFEARMTHSTHFGVLDPVRTPESNHAGVDVRATIFAHRDEQGNLYTPFRDVKTNKIVLLKAGDLMHNIVAFPHQELKGQVDAFVKGRVQKIDAKKVNYQASHLAQVYSPATSLIPMIHNIQGNRAIMGSKMGTQALPLLEREPPLVQVKSHIGDHSFEELYGHMIVPRSPVKGKIKKIEDGWIYIQPDSKTYPVTKEGSYYSEDPETLIKVAGTPLIKVPYQTNFPFPSKTFLHHTLNIRAGQNVEEGQALGDSNFTRNATLALGKNLRVAYMAYHGLNSNDAVVISEGCARKLTSEHMYREVYPITPQTQLSKEKHRIYYGSKYTPAQYASLNEAGIVKKGSLLHNKDIIIAGLSPNPIQGTDALLGRISKSLTKPYRESILQWEHASPGEVIDVVQTSNQIAILIKTQERMQVGDKLCYDEETEILTELGWKSIATVTVSDRVATLEDNKLFYREPSAVHKYATGDRMYHIRSQQVDLLVTEKHRMYVQSRGDYEYSLKTALEIAGKRVRYKKDAIWEGSTPLHITLPALTVIAGQSGNGVRDLPEINIPIETYAMLLGAFISEGNIVDQPSSGSYGIDITQVKTNNRLRLLKELLRLNIPFSEHGRGSKIRIYSKQLLEHFRPLGKAHVKYIPQYVFSWDTSTLEILFDWLMWGDGHTSKKGLPIAYTTTSPQLADDVQRLCLHIGKAANITSRHTPKQIIKGKVYACLKRYDVRIINTKLRPEVNHGHYKTQNGQSERWIEDYNQAVYCVTVPSGVVYVRRNGKSVWSGNSGRYGNKGVVARIIPDHKMIRDEGGQPIDLILTSAGVVSRINPAQVIETAVGKVAEKMQQPILYDNTENKNAVQWAKDLLKKHGIKDKEIVFDPVHERHISGPDGKGVLVGRQYIYKLFKSTDTNFSGHGVGPYDLNEQPLKTGGDESAKGIGKMEFDALLAHNARNILHEAATIRGQKNDEFWKAIQLGQALPTPKPSFAFNKFTAMLEGAGIKVDKRGSKFRLMPLTDRDVKARSAGAIENNKTIIAKNLKPETGGLFDPVKTGGSQGTLYSHIDLHEPIVHPVFEEPVRRLLGLTQKQLDQQIGEKGGAWIHSQLKEIHVPNKLIELRERMKKVRGVELNNVVKQIKYLEALNKENLKPHEAYIINKVPVIPPIFRPILPQPHDPSQLMVADANKLYAHLMDANHVLKGTILPSDLGNHRTQVYNAVSALYGTQEIANEELKGQSVKGFLTQISGQGSPKGGFFQRKLMRRTQDVSGRGTAVPDGNLGMDEVGLPEEMLWKMFDKLLVARLIRTGYPALQAREIVDKRTPAAHDALMMEIKERPVLINRAPTLHRFSITAAYAKPVMGKTIRVNPFVEKGMNLDYDGDTLQVHAPVTTHGIEDAKKMTMSNLLLSDQTRNKLMAFPQHEAILGVTLASKTIKNPTSTTLIHSFKTRDEAISAWRKGNLKLTDHIEIKNVKQASEEDEERDKEPVTSEDALFFLDPEYVLGEQTDTPLDPIPS